AAGGLLARAHVAVPVAAALPPGARDAVGAFEHEAVGRLLDPGRTACMPFAVHAPPGAERGQLEPHGPVGRDEAVNDSDRRPAVRHRELASEDDAADPPAPARTAVLQAEGAEQLVAPWADDAAAPF